MYARVVRFTDVNQEQLDRIKNDVDNNDPPDGMPPSTLRVVRDESQDTAAVVFFFESEADMQKADGILDAMDSGETLGTRTSVDKGEVVIEGEISG